MVLHHLTRGQLGEAVNADGTDKRAFYKEQQQKIAILQQSTCRRDHNAAGEIYNRCSDRYRRQ